MSAREDVPETEREQEDVPSLRLPRREQRCLGMSEPYVLTGVELSPITLLCGEPGMGKTYLVNLLIHELSQAGGYARRYTLAHVSEEDACLRIVRLCGEIVRQRTRKCPQLVVIDNLCAGDEWQVSREATALRKLSKCVPYVVVCLRPESYQLAEELEEAAVLQADDFLFKAVDMEGDEWDLTGGIPQLVGALAIDRKSDPEAAGPRGRYGTAAEELLRSSLRDGLIDEERRARLAMVLLGHGTLEEVHAVSGRCDRELFGWLAKEAPLFGVDARERTFSCHGFFSDDLLFACMGTLHLEAAREPSLFKRACSALAARGDAARSVIICKLCGSELDFTRAGCHWGVSYALIGETGVVEEALRTAERLGMPHNVRHELSATALAELTGSSALVDRQRKNLESLHAGETLELRLFERVRLLGICRDLFRDVRLVPAVPVADTRDPLTEQTAMHEKAFRRLLGGRFSEAYTGLSNLTVPLKAENQVEALLCCDRIVSLVLGGGAPGVSEATLLEAAAAVFDRMRPCRARVYHGALRQLLEVLMCGGREARSLEEAASQAERVGDSVLQCVFLLATAVRDLRVRSASLAHVRAERAATIGRMLGMGYLIASAQLIDALALEMLGEPGALGACRARIKAGSELQLVVDMAARAAHEVDDVDAAQSIPAGTPCPRDAFWALRLLSEDCGSLSDAFRREMPSSWLDLLRAVEMRQLPYFSDDAKPLGSLTPSAAAPVTAVAVARGTQTELLAPSGDDARIHVRLLGAFEVTVDGKELSIERFNRRGARELLTLLAIVPGHRLPRYRAVESIWPGADYHRGPRRIYEATGELRKLLREVGVAGNPVVSSRAQGTVGLDGVLVSCDVDEFEYEARLTLDEQRDDFWVLDHARNMLRLYGGGLDQRVMSLGSEAAERVQEIEALLVDGLVAAAEAALRVGKVRLAVRYAMDAHRISDLREDAMVVLVQALRAAGRSFEVRDLYLRFAQKLRRTEGVAPSLALRRAVERALGEDPDILS